MYGVGKSSTSTLLCLLLILGVLIPSLARTLMVKSVEVQYLATEDDGEAQNVWLSNTTEEYLNTLKAMLPKGTPVPPSGPSPGTH